MILAFLLLLGLPANDVPADLLQDRRVVDVSVQETMDVPSDSLFRTADFILADGSIVSITRRYPAPYELPEDAGLLTCSLYLLYLQEQARLDDLEAADLLDEARSLARLHPRSRLLVLPAGRGRGSLLERR